MVAQAARLAALPEPLVVTFLKGEWPRGQEGWRVKLVLGRRVLLPGAELTADRLALTLRLMAAGDPLP